MTAEGEPRRRSWLAMLIALATLMVTLDFSLQPITGIDTDTWWHLAGGRVMFESHHLALTDPFSSTAVGHVWINRHWLFQLLLYASYAVGGLDGMVVLRSVLEVGAFGVLATAALQRGARMPAVAVAVVWAAWIESAYWHIRPHYVSLLCAAVCILLLQRGVNGRPRAAWGLPVVLLVWNNAHGGAALVGFVTVVIFGAGDWLRRRASTDHAASGVAWPALIAACFVALWISPQPYDNLVYVLRLSFQTNPYTAHDLTMELRPLDLLAPAHRATLLFLIAAAMAAIWHGCQGRWTDVMLVVAYGWLVPRMDRHQYLVIPLLIPTLSTALQAAFHGLPLRARWRRPAAAALALLSIVVVAREGAAIDRRAFPPSQLIRLETLPEGAARYLDAHALDGPIFNDLMWGGYLVWRRAGHNPVYIDGRNDLVYPMDDTLIEEYLSILHGNLAPLDRRGIRLAVIQPGIAPPLEDALDRSWQRRFDDGASRVYVHGDSATPHETATSAPGNGPWVMDEYSRAVGKLEQQPEAAETELRVAIALDAGCPRCWVQLGLALARQGRLEGARDAWRHALLITPLLHTVHRNLAVVALNQNDIPRAADELVAELSLGNDPQAQHMLDQIGGASPLSSVRNAWRAFWAPLIAP